MSARPRPARGAVLYAVLTFFSFPVGAGSASFDVGLLFAFLGPWALIHGLRGLGPRAAFGWGLAAGLLAHCAVLHWIYVVTVIYGHAWPPVGVIAVALLALYIAFFTGLFGAGSVWLDDRLGAANPRLAWASPFLLAMLWTVLDHLRSFALFSGFPWATLGYAQHQNPLLMALAPVVGVYGLSFVTALGGAAAADALAGKRRSALAAAAAVALAHGLGGLLLLRPVPEGDETVRVAVLQGNIDQGAKWSSDWQDRTLRIYEDLTRRAAAEGAQVVVWPETAVPGSPDTDLDLRERLVVLARTTGTTLVAGAVGIEGYDPVQQRPVDVVRFFDSALIVDADGRFRDRYDKTHLVPFGEYIPLRALLGRFITAIATGATAGDVSPGQAVRSVEIPIRTGPGPADPAAPSGDAVVSAGVPICYELLFPDLMRGFAGDGARVLLAITNDAWYGRTGAPYQFAVMTALRAAESGLWTARAANTGISALIDGRGRIRSRTEIFERDFLVGDVPLRPRESGQTPYVRHGDLLVLACWIGLGAAAVVSRRRPKT